MPKFYCDYCDIALAHSSMTGRRQHNAGRKHIQNKIDYFQKIMRDQGLAPLFPGMHPGIPLHPTHADPQSAAAAALARMI